MLQRTWALLRASVEGYIEDDALSRGAAIAYYTVFSIAPLLVIATAVAGLLFGEDAVHGAISEELRDLLGKTGADTVEAMIAGAGNKTSGTIATIIGLVTLLLTASGVFGELQAALNAIWRATPPTGRKTGEVVTRVLRAKLAALGLVAATGFLLLVSLVVSTVISAFATWIGGIVPEVLLLIGLANFTISFLMVAALFAAIYKILPDRPIAWADVGVGALVTAFLFTVGKSLIGWYIGSSSFASSYGAAGALMVVLLWVYYSAQIFLLGAEFTRAWAGLHAPPVPRVPVEVVPAPKHHWVLPAAAGALLMALLRGRK